jgi:hypothetical protein
MSVQLFANRALKLVDVGPLGKCSRLEKPKSTETSGKNGMDLLLSHIVDVCTASGVVSGVAMPVGELVKRRGGAHHGMGGFDWQRVLFPHVSTVQELREFFRSREGNLSGDWSFVFDAPAGEICSQKVFQKSFALAQAYSADLAAWWAEESAEYCDKAAPAVAANGILGDLVVRPVAILRSALTCRYSG